MARKKRGLETIFDALTGWKNTEKREHVKAKNGILVYAGEDDVAYR